MKLAYLTEVAALLSAHGHLLVHRSDELPPTLLGDYYIQSRNRFNRWMRDLNDIGNDVHVRDPLHLIGLNPLRPQALSLTEQILVNDLVNRIWTTILAAADCHLETERYRPLADNVFQGHSIVRAKALDLCSNHRSLSPADIITVEKLQVSAERWSDLLCCGLMAEFGLWQYAFDPDRAREFHQDRFQQNSLDPRSQGWTLILAGLRHSFPDNGVAGLGAPIHEDDRLITRLMLDSFPRESPEMAFWSRQSLVRAAQA